MLLLIIGDLFIPDREIELPPQFRKLLAPNAPAVPSNAKIDQVLCLGNITQSQAALRFLHDLSPQFHIVRGEFDDAVLVGQQVAALEKDKGGSARADLPLYKIVAAGNFKIGFTAGSQIMPRNDPLLLLAFAREIDVDILVWGGTHRVEAYALDGKFFVNPGSATGAFTFGWPEPVEKPQDGEETGEKKNDEEEKEKGDEKEESAESAREDVEENGPTEAEDGTPSFCLLDTAGNQCTLYIYTCVGGEVKVDKVMFLNES